MRRGFPQHSYRFTNTSKHGNHVPVWSSKKDRAPEALVAHYFGGDLSKDLKRPADLSGWVYDPSQTEKKFDFVYNGPIEGRLLEAKVCKGGPTENFTIGKIQWMIDPDARLLREDEAGIRCGWAVRVLWPEELERQSNRWARQNTGVRPQMKFFNDYKILPVYRADRKTIDHPDSRDGGIVKRLYYISGDPNISSVKMLPLRRSTASSSTTSQLTQGSGGTSSMMMMMAAPAEESQFAALETSDEVTLSSQAPAAEVTQTGPTTDNSAALVTEALQSGDDTRTAIEDPGLQFNEIATVPEPKFDDQKVMESFNQLLTEVGVDPSKDGAQMLFNDFEVSFQSVQDVESRLNSEAAPVAVES